jgi:hypothetical protein
MKNILLIVMAVSLTISCGIEKKTVRKSVKYEAELVAIAQKLFDQYSNRPEKTKLSLDDLVVTKQEKRLLHKKLRFETVKVIYEYDEILNYGLLADSVVVFKRGGVVNKGAEIVVDMHRKPMGNLPVTHGNAYTRLSERLYSRATIALINQIISDKNGKTKTGTSRTGYAIH